MNRIYTNTAFFYISYSHNNKESIDIISFKTN